MELVPSDATYFGNILAAHSQMNQFAEGLERLEATTEAIRRDQSVQTWEASLLTAAGQWEEADAIYARLFGDGYRNDDDFVPRCIALGFQTVGVGTTEEG